MLTAGRSCPRWRQSPSDRDGCSRLQGGQSPVTTHSRYSRIVRRSQELAEVGWKRDRSQRSSAGFLRQPEASHADSCHANTTCHGRPVHPTGRQKQRYDPSCVPCKQSIAPQHPTQPCRHPKLTSVSCTLSLPRLCVAGVALGVSCIIFFAHGEVHSLDGIGG
jgi:hypothetical protein